MNAKLHAGKHSAADYRDLGLLAVLWAGAFALTDIAVETMSPAWSVSIRMLVSAAVLAPMMIIKRERFPHNKHMWGWLTALALCGDLIPFFLLSWGIALIDSGLAAILVGIMPLITLLLARIFIPGEILTAMRIAGFATGLVGMVVVIGPSALTSASNEGTPLLGEILVLGAAFFFAVNAIVARRAPPAPLYTKACLTTGLAGVLMFPLAWAGGPLDVSAVSTNSWAAVVVLGALPVGYATVVYFRIIESAGPSFMAMTNYLVPVLALALGAIFLDETVTLHALAGLVIILAGIALAELKR
jgi:drug/metabolite transporter (DMT)-like permease